MVDLEAGRALCRLSEKDDGIEVLEKFSDHDWRSVCAVSLMNLDDLGKKERISVGECFVGASSLLRTV